MKPILIFLCISFFALNSTSAQKSENQINLTSSDVEQFIEEFPSLRQEFEEFDMKYNTGSNEFTAPEGMEALNKVNALVKKHGYQDYNDFIVKTGSIITSYAAISSEKEMKNAQPEIEKALAEIENSEYYTEEQKEQMKAMMMQSMEAINNMGEMASPENIAIVEPYVEEITKVLEED